MINIVCTDCGTAIRTTGDEGEVQALLGEGTEWYPDQYPCPGCSSKASVIDSIDPSALKALNIFDLTAQEAYSAFNGLGLPEERECGPLAVREAFKSAVVTIKCDLIKGSNRSVLKSIVFADGTRMYFGSSPYGATVYRIAKKHIESEVTDG